MPFQPIDWTDCPLVERDPYKLGGVPISAKITIRPGDVGCGLAR
jgi:hypothetical protein